MYNQPVGPFASTGIGVGGVGAVGIYTFTDITILSCVFIFMATFTIIGAFGAGLRTLPAIGFLYREPKKKAPTDEDKAKWIKRY